MHSQNATILTVKKTQPYIAIGVFTRRAAVPLSLSLSFCGSRTSVPALLAQTIQGPVTDAATGESLPGADIVAKGAETIGTPSNQDGTFGLDDIGGAHVLPPVTW